MTDKNSLEIIGKVFYPGGSRAFCLSKSVPLLRAFFTALDTEGASTSLTLPDGSVVNGVDVYTFLNAGSQTE